MVRFCPATKNLKYFQLLAQNSTKVSFLCVNHIVEWANWKNKSHFKRSNTQGYSLGNLRSVESLLSSTIIVSAFFGCHGFKIIPMSNFIPILMRIERWWVEWHLENVQIFTFMLCHGHISGKCRHFVLFRPVCILLEVSKSISKYGLRLA